MAAYTRGGAFARFSENHIGTLETGKDADLIVLSQDIFSVPVVEIGKTQVLMTMTGGKIVLDKISQKKLKTKVKRKG